MPTVETLHAKSMDLAEEAFLAQKKGNRSEARNLFLRALDFEQKAVSQLSPIKSSEPTRSILYRSAASIAYHAGDYESAERLIANGLSGYPPPEIKDELKNLYEDINFMLHLSGKGLILTPDQWMMTIAGNSVKYGSAAAEILMTRVEVVTKLFYRTVERLLKVPYRISSRISREIKDKYGLFVNAFIPGSFAVSFQIGCPDPQLLLFDELKKEPVEPSDVIDEIMKCFEVFENDDSNSLKERFNDDDYFENFVALAKQIAPDGENVKSVGFVSLSKNQERPVSLRKTRKEFVQLADIHTKNETDEDIVKVSYTGLLRYANSPIKGKFGTVKLIDSDTKRTHNINVPISLMKDVVQPFYEEYVIIQGYNKNGKIYLEEIQLEP
jgi:hypothetical protein